MSSFSISPDNLPPRLLSQPLNTSPNTVSSPSWFLEHQTLTHINMVTKLTLIHNNIYLIKTCIRNISSTSTQSLTSKPRFTSQFSLQIANLQQQSLISSIIVHSFQLLHSITSTASFQQQDSFVAQLPPHVLLDASSLLITIVISLHSKQKTYILYNQVTKRNDEGRYQITITLIGNDVSPWNIH